MRRGPTGQLRNTGSETLSPAPLRAALIGECGSPSSSSSKRRKANTPRGRSCLERNERRNDRATLPEVTPMTQRHFADQSAGRPSKPL
ncbi:hypothetical protein MRX96_058971 [Rhipicephalus microplus]